MMRHTIIARLRFPALLTMGVLVSAIDGSAQHAHPVPLPAPPTAITGQPSAIMGQPAALSVPHPIPPVSLVPRVDLFAVPQPPPPPDFDPPHEVYGPTVFVPTGYGPVLSTPTPPRPAPPLPRGSLRFETSPSSAQVYVDGAYAGLVQDFGIFGHAMDLGVGPHHIELRAEAYVPAGFDVRIAENQTTRFRGDLTRAMVSAPVRTVATPKPTYIIPNCYAGDKPPTRALRQGCSVAQMQIRQP